MTGRPPSTGPDAAIESSLRLSSQATELAFHAVRLLAAASAGAFTPAPGLARLLRLNLEGVAALIALEPNASFHAACGATDECTRLLTAAGGWERGATALPEELALLRDLLRRFQVSDRWFDEALAALAAGKPIAAEPPPPTSWRALGVEFERYTHHALLYSAPANSLLLTLEPDWSRGVDRRLFIRQVEEERYREVLLETPRAHLEAVVVGSDAPVAFLHVGRWGDDTRKGSDFEGLFRLGLPEGRLEKLPAPRFEDDESRTWISNLLGASGDAASLHVVAGRPVHQGPIGQRMGYCLATYDVPTGLLRRIAELPAIFA